MKTFHLISIFPLILFITGIFVGQVHTNVINVTSSHVLPVKFNDRVVLTCHLKRLANDTQNPILFMVGNEIKSENCITFDDFFSVDCSNRSQLKFEIKRMSWETKGTWKCMYNSVTKSVFVDIYVPNNLSISINTIPQPINSPNLGPASIPMKHEISTALRGRGTPLHPFDLRSDINAKVTCKSDCGGYPDVYHIYNFTNSSNYSLALNRTSFNFETTICDYNKNTSSSMSTFILNCKELELYGLFNLSCATYHSFNIETTVKMSEEQISILCPTPNESKWWSLTSAEMVHIGIACVIALILLMLLCLVLCRWRSNNHKKYDSCQDDNGDTKIGRGYRV